MGAGGVDAGDDKNFWRMAETGPCGPCSEITTTAAPPLEGPTASPTTRALPRWLEILEPGLQELEQLADGRACRCRSRASTPAWASSGLASVLQGVGRTRHRFVHPIHDVLRRCSATTPSRSSRPLQLPGHRDHSRAITFLVADGVLPSNEGPGYVLPRGTCSADLRRAVRHGRLLGRHEPFLVETARAVIATMADAYPYLRDEEERVLAVIAARRPVRPNPRCRHGPAASALAGLSTAGVVVGRRPDDVPADAPVLDGALAFRLHDTFRLPDRPDRGARREHGCGVPGRLRGRPGRAARAEPQRQEGRAARRAELAQPTTRSCGRRRTPPSSLRDDGRRGDGRGILRDGVAYDELTGAGEAEVVLDRPRSTARAAARSATTGALREPGGGSVLFDVATPRSPSRAGRPRRSPAREAPGRGSVEAVVDAERRARTMRNHTATHLLHRTLRNWVGPGGPPGGARSLHPDYPPLRLPRRPAITAGSGAASRTRCAGSSRGPAGDVELLDMHEADRPRADAFFDEIGETVRTIRVQDYSFELCGGTHCRASARSAGSSSPRAEHRQRDAPDRAMTGDGADAWMRSRAELLDLVARPCRRPVPRGDRRPLRRPPRTSCAMPGAGCGRAAGTGLPKPGELAPGRGSRARGPPRRRRRPLPSIEELKGAAKDVRGILGSGVVALALDGDEPQLFVTVSDDLVARGIAAGTLVREAVAHLDGKGGGRPEMAQGKGTRREGSPPRSPRSARP